jgi:DNA-binding beta-propeller fold protein YncE
LITSNSVIKYPKFIALDLTNNKIFYRSNTPTNSDYKIRRANLDGSGIEANYISGHLNSGIEGIAVDPTNSRIYWAGRDSDKIYRANLDGTGQIDLITGLNDPRGIALDLVNNKIYWCDHGTDKIHRANISDGSGKEDVVTGLVNPEGITIATLTSSIGGSIIKKTRYVPFTSKYLLMALMALLGGWFVLRSR